MIGARDLIYVYIPRIYASLPAAAVTAGL